MKIKPIVLALTLGHSLNVLAADEIPASASQAAAQPAAKAVTPQTPEEWLMRMTDFTRNASAYKDPRVFVPWFNAVTEPSFYTAMGQGMMDPAGWLNMMNSMAHPNAYRNWAEFADPDVTMRWLAASMDPAFYTALLTQLSDPGKAMRWAMWPMDPKLWGLMLNMFNPNLYMKWGVAAMDPRAWALMGSMMNPATYTGFMGAMMDPKSYGQAWGNMLGYVPAAPVTMTNPWGSTTAGTGGFNFFDPAALMGMFAVPMTGVAAPVPAATAAPAAPAQGTVTVPALPKTSEPAKPVEAAKPASPKQVEAAKPAAAAKPVEAAKPAQVAKLDAAPQPAALVPATSKLVLSGDTLFSLGKSGIRDLTPAGKKSLDEVAAKIKALGDVEQINIVGHADASGKASANQKLSEYRARSVKSYLVAKGVKPGVIITSGVGDSQPVVQCDMKLPSPQLAECLAPNRRVEIEVVSKPK